MPSFKSYAKEVDYGYYHGYTLFDRKETEPRFPFGLGLSYTIFTFSDLKVITPNINPASSVIRSIDIENTGNCKGAEVAQLYIGFNNSKTDRPVKILRGFRKTTGRIYFLGF